MPGFPRSEKFRKLFAAYGVPQRRQFWQATGIDISKQKVNEEMFTTFKASLADYRKFLAKSDNQVTAAPSVPPSDLLCDACGSPDMSVIYVMVPKCGRFCATCIDELIHDAESST